MCDQETTYNGWSNRETWLVSLWLNEALDERSAEASLWSDLLRTTFCRINWVEVVEKNFD